MRQTFQIAVAAIFPIMALATPATAALTVLTFAESGVTRPPPFYLPTTATAPRVCPLTSV